MMMMSASSSSSSTLALGFGNHHHCSSSKSKTHVLNKKITQLSATPRTINHPSTTLHHDHHHQVFRGSSSGPSAPLVLESDETHNTKPLGRFNFRRREAIGLGLLLGVVDAFVQKPQEVFAATAAADKDQELKCEFTVTNSGLQFCERVVGYGPEATKGQLIKAHYVGKLENGKVFDSSYNRGKPLTFRVGVGEVIKGWDQGIIGGDGVPPMLAGGKRTLKLPPELGYGARGAGCKGGSCIIPPNSVLLFDVEFIGKA